MDYIVMRKFITCFTELGLVLELRIRQGVGNYFVFAEFYLPELLFHINENLLQWAVIRVYSFCKH